MHDQRYWTFTKGKIYVPVGADVLPVCTINDDDDDGMAKFAKSDGKAKYII